MTGEQTNDMNASISCISCLIGKQEKLIRRFSDEDKKNAFFQDFLTVVQQEGLNRTAPWLQGKADRPAVSMEKRAYQRDKSPWEY